MSASQYGIYPVNEGYLKPRTKVGMVILNGGINTALCLKARYSKQPLYKRAEGADSNNFDRAEQGDIVFTLSQHQAALHALSRDGSCSGMNGDANRAHGVTRLNGHGTSGDTNITFMHQLDILGVCEHDNLNAPKKLFNIIRGGMMTGLNNGSDTFYVNDWIMGWAPSPDEIEEGGKGKPADSNGDIQLRYKRYDPYLNKITTKSIYKCLTSKDKAPYLDTFIQSSEAFLEGSEHIALIIVAALFDQLGIPGTREAFLKKMLQLFKVTAIKSKIIDMLFAVHSDSPKWIDPNNRKSEMSLIQAEAPDKFISSASWHFHNVIKLVFARAMNYSRPKTNVDIQIGKYSL